MYGRKQHRSHLAGAGIKIVNKEVLDEIHGDAVKVLTVVKGFIRCLRTAERHFILLRLTVHV